MGLKIAKKTLTVTLAISIFFILFPAAPKAVDNQIVVASILDRMAGALKAMTSLQADLSQQKTYGQLGISDPVEEGLLYVKRKKNKELLVRLEIQQPAKRVITVKNKKFTLFQPSINQVIEGRVSQSLASDTSAAGFLSYLFGGLSQATKDYKILIMGEDEVGGKKTTHLRLVPRSNHKGLYRQIDLWVDNHLWLPTRQQFTEANQDVTVVQLDHIRVNVILKDHLFTQKLPPRVHRIRG